MTVLQSHKGEWGDKARLGFSSGSVILAEQLGRRHGESWSGNSLCGDAPRVWSKRLLGPGDGREASGMLWDLLSLPVWSWGPPLSPLSQAVLASLLSHELGSGGPGGEKPSPLAKTPREEGQKGGYGDRPQGGGSLLGLHGTRRMLIYSF